MSKVVISMVAMFILMIFQVQDFGDYFLMCLEAVWRSLFYIPFTEALSFSRAYRWMHRAYFGGDAVTER